MLLAHRDSRRQVRLPILPRAVVDLDPDVLRELELIGPAEPLLPPRIEAELRAEAAA